MSSTKSPLSSVGVWGVIAALLALWLGPDDARTFTENADRIVTSVAMLVALYGRLRAQDRLSLPSWVPGLGPKAVPQAGPEAGSDAAADPGPGDGRG